MSNQRFLLFIFLLFPFSLLAQEETPEEEKVSVSVLVLDKASGATLPFAHITTSKNQGAVTDIGGKATLEIGRADTLFISYQGFQTAKVTIPENMKEDTFFVRAALSELTTLLSEVEVRPFPSNIKDFNDAFLGLGNSDYRTEAQKKNDLAREQIAEFQKRVSMFDYMKVSTDAAENTSNMIKQAQDIQSGVSVGGRIYRSKRDKEMEKLKKIKEAERKRKEEELMRKLQNPLEMYTETDTTNKK
ncbi:hypothetical protein V6R21_26565 [Limibacter armeniacum]|uniref:hypothetical protein n=1 Tax=Limibacter armeniacum TaxID=466084 RepID=UPI002FE5D808